MKTSVKTFILFALVFVIACKKKETKSEDPIVPAPTEPTYSSFSSTIAVIDYTNPVNVSTISYTANLSPATAAMAYIIADGTRVDSLILVITRTTDIVPSTVSASTATPCDANIWSTYSLNSKEFKLKTGSNNSLEIREDGILVSSRPIRIESTYIQYDFSNGYNASSPKVKG